MTLNFETDYLIEQLKEKKPKKVLVQLPEGVKQNAFEISKVFEDLNIEVVFSGETCWGGCAIAVEEAKSLGSDLIVHFGHAKFIETPEESPEILYIEIRDELNLIPWLEKSLKELEEFKKIGLSYSIQHRHDIKKVIKFYEDNGKKIVLSKKIGNVAYEGHIIGCQYSGLKSIEDKVDCFVILGNNFHSMGAALSVEKPVFLIDVYNDKITNMKGVRDKILKQRIVSVEKFKNSKNIGVIIETKIGQKFGMHDLLIKKLKEKGKNVILITMNEMTPDKLMNFYYIDCFIELACPRIAIDDFAKYEKPILTFKEALIGLGDLTWDEVLKKGIV